MSGPVYCVLGCNYQDEALCRNSSGQLAPEAQCRRRLWPFV